MDKDKLENTETSTKDEKQLELEKHLLTDEEQDEKELIDDFFDEEDEITEVNFE